jgi:hypothetical protein
MYDLTRYATALINSTTQNPYYSSTQKLILFAYLAFPFTFP